MSTAVPSAVEALLAPARARAIPLSFARWLPWLVAALALALGVAIMDGLPVGVVHDDGMYVVLAKALATGQGYRWIHVPGAPPATHFPPGYPAFLALLWLAFPAFPQNIVVFKLANACFVAIAAAVFAVYARDRFAFAPWAAALLAVFATLGIPLLTLSVMVMSEPLFLALLVAILLAAERSVDATSSRRRDLVLLGLATGAATLVRSHGIALIAALPFVLVLKRRRIADAALFGATAMLVVLPWQLWSGAHAGVVPPVMRGNYESYGAWLAAGLRAHGIGLLWRTAGRTTVEIAAMFATLTAPTLPAVPRYAALAVLAVLGVLGVRALWRRAPVTAVFLALYSAIVIVWPFTPARFFWGVWPFIVLVPVLGAREIWTWKPIMSVARWTRVTAMVLVAGVATGYVAYNLRGYRGRWWSSIPRAGAANLRPLVLWAMQRTAPTDVLAVEGESAVYLYANRKTIPVHTFTVEQYFQSRTPAQEAEVIQALLGSYHVAAVAVTTNTMRAAATLLTSRTPPALALSDSFPGGVVLTPIRQ